MNTQLKYSYRNGSQKKERTLVLSGEFQVTDLELIAQSLRQGTLFIPDQVGLSSLHDGQENDHVWHAFHLESIQLTSKRSDAALTWDELASNMKSVIWDVTAATNRMFGNDRAPQTAIYRRAM